MPVAFIPRALLHPETQQPMAFPAIDMRSNERVDDATAYRPAALDQLEILRPHRALQRALAYLAHPDTAALSPAELREGLRTFTEDVLMGDVY